jgi:hypothetical protein
VHAEHPYQTWRNQATSERPRKSVLASSICRRRSRVG